MFRHAPLRALVSAAAATALLTLAACSGASTDAASPAPSSSADAQFPKTIKHAMGTTEIPSRPIRVTTLDTSFTDSALALGAQIVGYAPYRKEDQGFPAYNGDVSAQTKDAINVGPMTEPSLEKILDSKPDVIISAKVRSEGIYGQLSKIAPTVFGNSTGPDWKNNFLMVGDVLGKQAEAEKMLSDYQDRAAKIGKEILAKNPGLTYSYVRFFGEDTARLYASKSFFGDIMKSVGINRPANAPDSTSTKVFTPLSQERILDADAGLIVVSTTSNSDKAVTVRESFMKNPLWSKMKGKVVVVDDRVFSTSGSITGANAALTSLAQSFGVDPLLPAK